MTSVVVAYSLSLSDVKRKVLGSKPIPHSMNKLTSEMGNFFTDTMRDSNSHEFDEMVDPITCTPNEEPEENIC